MKRRKRSYMTEADCTEALREFSKVVDRMMETSQGFAGEAFAPKGSITVQFQIRGSFGTSINLFEAIRVLGGHKLPAKLKEVT